MAARKKTSRRSKKRKGRKSKGHIPLGILEKRHAKLGRVIASRKASRKRRKKK